MRRHLIPTWNREMKCREEKKAIEKGLADSGKAERERERKEGLHTLNYDLEDYDDDDGWDTKKDF